MEPKNYNDCTAQELADLYTKYRQEGNNTEAQIIYEYLIIKEKEQTKQPVLASAGSRFGAYIIDGLIIVIPIMVIMFILIAKIFQNMNFDAEVMQNGTTDLETIHTMQYNIMSSVLGTIILLFFGMHILYLLINGWLLYSRGQTIGKKLMHIKVVDTQNNKPSFSRIFFLRYLVSQLLAFVPFYSLADALFIFGKDRKCIHDHMAGTKVIVDEPGEYF